MAERISLPQMIPNTDYRHICKNCRYFEKEKSQPSAAGDCRYIVRFPDSFYARSEGQRKRMTIHDGVHCPCFERKELVEAAHD
jgi:hypothetical protein